MDGVGDTHLINLKHQRVSMEYDQCDRISNLPDSLLFDILSFLKMEDVIKTSLLSRKWRYFWTTVPCLNFKASWEIIKRATYEAFVDRALFAYEASKIKKFRLSYVYRVNSNAFQVDSWIRFAIRHHVEDFELDFIRGCQYVPEILWDHNAYKLHSSCFNSMSLTSLKLRFCNLNLPASMCLNSLKFLSLEVMELSYDTIKKLTSSCPVLEELFLKECNWRSDLIICIPELPLKSLKIEECSTYSSYRNTMFEIYAPNLVSLEFLGYMQRSKYRFKGPSSLLKMIFDVDIDGDGDYLEYGENDGHPLRQFLDDLKHVKDLKIGAWSVQAMSISELKKPPALSLGANSLELVTELSESELQGLAYILRSCPFLKTLIITVETSQLMMFTHEFQNKYEYDVRIHWEPQELALSSTLHHIETIKLLCFSEELMDGEAKTTDELIKAHMSQIELVRFFLQNCKLLQRMILTRHMDSRLAGKPLKLPLKFSQQLLEFPRASAEAELIFL